MSFRPGCVGEVLLFVSRLRVVRAPSGRSSPRGHSMSDENVPLCLGSPLTALLPHPGTVAALPLFTLTTRLRPLRLIKRGAGTAIDPVPYGSALPTWFDYRPTSPSETSARCRSLLARRMLSSTSAPVVSSRRARRRLTAIAASSNTTTAARSSPLGFLTGGEVSERPRGADTSIRERCLTEDRCSRMLTTSTGAMATTTAKSMSGIAIRNAMDISSSQVPLGTLAFSFHLHCGRPNM